MRLFLGIVLGICLTVGITYMSDVLRTGPGPDGVQARPMVNWDVVDRNVQDLSSRVQFGWARLTRGRDV
jgi:hypothetical protein